MIIPKMKISDLTFKIPIIQGGMGVGISKSSLAAAVAKEGGLGVISCAQIGYEESDFEINSLKANIRVLKREIKKAKEDSSGGLIGVNIMVALKNYSAMVKAAVDEQVDVIISGAGLPIDLPDLVKNTKTKIIPIVSSLKAARVITRVWNKNYNRQADAIIVEGPQAGGHLGFKMDELKASKTKNLETIVKEVVEYFKGMNKNIPIIAAGGIFDGYDIAKYLKLGASGVQMATRFVPTFECDASRAFKEAYIAASPDDIVIINSPVGLPGRAINNQFIQKLERIKKEKITKCHQCLHKCDPKEAPYCITKALINAVKGNLKDSLIFVGSNASKCKEIQSVKDVIQSLLSEMATV